MGMKLRIILIVLALVVLSIIGYKSVTGWFVTPGNYDDFAKCLTNKGVMMYGSKYCPHCANQKKMFGSSFKYINYVECADNPQPCIEKGVQAVPAWLINGNLYIGEKTIEELSSLSGCKLS